MTTHQKMPAPSPLGHIREWVFDMDHTLYPAEDALFSQIEILMSDYTQKLTGLDRAQADKLRHHYWRTYGASVTGLMKHHDVEPADFLHQVHQIDFTVLNPNPELKTEIKSLPGRKTVFTNGPKAYANRVLEQLQLNDCFDHIYGFEDANYHPKPHPLAYDTVFQDLKLDHTKAIMFEDSHENLKVPFDLGMQTVLVHENHDGPYIHYQTDCLVNFLRQID